MSESEDNQLENLLRNLPADNVKAPAYLAGRIMANLPDEIEEDPFTLLRRWLIGTAWRGLGTVAVPVLIGFTLGYSQVEPQPYEVNDMLFAQTYEVYELHEE